MSEDQKIWFVYLTDHHEGPFTVAEVAAKHAQGLVEAKTLAWKDGMPEWVALETIPELAAILSAVVVEAPAFSTPKAETHSAGDAWERPTDDEQVWNLKNAGAVSGPFSMEQLVAMAKSGDLSENFQLWAPGLTNFQEAAQFPDLAKQRKTPSLSSLVKGLNKASTTTTKKTGITKSINRSANDEDPTDPSIQAPSSGESFLAKISTIFPLWKTNAAAGVGSASSSASGSIKRMAIVLGVFLLLVGGGGAYYLFFTSPIPAMEDVRPEDFEQMKIVAKSSLKEGAKIYPVPALGDDTSPTYYIASNLPEGTVITMSLSGIAGTLINAISFEKKITASVMKTRIASFGPISNDGKPIPMGEYNMSIVADGGVKLDQKIFLGGKKTGPMYERRMKQYKEKLQSGYDQEVQELREYIQTLKSMRDELDKKVVEYKGSRSAVTWKAFGSNFSAIAAQLDQKLKDKIATMNTAEKYYPGSLKDIQALLTQLTQYYQLQNIQFETGKTQNTADIHALIQAGVQSLDQFLAQAVVRAPLDVLIANFQQSHQAPNSTQPVSAAAPAVTAPNP